MPWPSKPGHLRSNPRNQALWIRAARLVLDILVLAASTTQVIRMDIIPLSITYRWSQRAKFQT
jgi:hypothetical protein